jgi:Holliday junction DNA helicase RuvA
MIAELEGIVSRKGERLVVLATGGIGWRVYVSAETHKTLPAPGEPLKLLTYLAVRENALDLYGFSEARELAFFELLIEVPGVGPKSALAILGIAPPETLERAVSSGDASYLTKVAGVGRKTAEKIVLELGDKVASLKTEGLGIKEESDALEGLRSLGYSLAEVREALKAVPVEVTNASDKIKLALKHLGRKP